MIDLEGFTERQILLPASPEEVARYFSGNETLLKQLVGAERVERIAPSAPESPLERPTGLRDGLIAPSAPESLLERPTGLRDGLIAPSAPESPLERPAGLIAPLRYHVSVGRFEALGLVVDPHFEVVFQDFPGVTRMQSTSCRVVTSSHLDLDLAAGFSGEARFNPHPEGCLLTSWSAVRVEILRLPGFLRSLPAGLIRKIGSTVITTALDAMSARFVPLIAEDFASWRRSQSLVESPPQW